MKSHLMLWKAVANEYGDICDVSTTRDFETVTRRTEHEGFPFLGVTLPAYCKDFEEALTVGRVLDDHFHSFHRVRGGLPAFLQGFLRGVFDPGTLVRRDEPDIDSIQAIRQLTLMFGKVEVDVVEEKSAKAFSQFVSTDQDVRSWTESNDFDSYYLRRFKAISSTLFGTLFDRMSRDIDAFEIFPKHGPGATADRVKGNLKYDIGTWYQRMENVFPSSEYIIPNHRFYQELDRVNFLEPGNEVPVRVITVPKTVKGPRIIAIEPAHVQYMQQGVLDCLNRNYTEDVLGYRFTKFIGDKYQSSDKEIRPSDMSDAQERNRALAQLGSLDGSLATLDLSEASDRVPLLLVEEMLAWWPSLKEAVLACRSLTADVPGTGVIPLAKFASMGSALCFPMEAFVFTTCVFMGIERATGREMSNFRNVADYFDSVAVFGDDIIVPSDCASTVVDTLEGIFPFKVNRHKSFMEGYFRESCGKEYYRGTDVSIVRIRDFLPSSLADQEAIVRAVSFRNNLYFGGLWKTARWMDEYLSKVLKIYPTVAPTSPGLGRHTVLDVVGERVSDTLHRPEVKAYVVSPKIPASSASWLGSLLKCLSKRSSDPFEDDKHLTRSGRPVAVSIKPRWAPIR